MPASLGHSASLLGSTTTSSRRETAIAPLRWRQRDEVPANITSILRTNHEATSNLSDARRVSGYAVAPAPADVQPGRAAGRPLDARRSLYLGHGRRLCAGRGDRGLRRLRRDDQAVARRRRHAAEDLDGTSGAAALLRQARRHPVAGLF